MWVLYAVFFFKFYMYFTSLHWSTEHWMCGLFRCSLKQSIGVQLLRVLCQLVCILNKGHKLLSGLGFFILVLS